MERVCVAHTVARAGEDMAGTDFLRVTPKIPIEGQVEV